MWLFFVNGHICFNFNSEPPIFSNLEVHVKKKTTRSRFLKIASNIKKGYVNMHNISENLKNLRSQF